MDSVYKKIEQRISAVPEKTPFIVADFLDLADSDAVRLVLFRLVQKGEIKRAMDGIFYRPKFNEFLRVFEFPSVQSVAETLARKNGWKICATGSSALNQLGISTQVPSAWTFISNGPYCSYPYENTLITFKHGAQRHFCGMSPLTMLVVQAMKYLGKEACMISEMRGLFQRLKKEKVKLILEESKQSTAWIYRSIYKICQELNYV